MKDRIIVTGAAGFIGFHLTKKLLDEGAIIYGIDDVNDYYDTKLKNDRLNILKKYSSFKFHKIDISDLNSLDSVFINSKPNKVVNLAAMAGVRYSIENPFAYVKSNIVGFVNIIELSKKYEVEGFIYASSSSVYGSNKKQPFSIKDRTDSPISLYAASKKSNELIAHSYSHLFGLRTTGLRFFTAYGPWGRPDMAMYIFADNISASKPINVFNNGKMKRDFTYIDDIVNGIVAAINKNYKCEVFNLGNNKTEDLMDVISLIENNLGKKSIINFLPIQPGDIKESQSDIDRSIDMLDYNPKTNVDVGIQKFIAWYKDYKK